MDSSILFDIKLDEWSCFNNSVLFEPIRECSGTHTRKDIKVNEFLLLLSLLDLKCLVIKYNRSGLSEIASCGCLLPLSFGVVIRHGIECTATHDSYAMTNDRLYAMTHDRYAMTHDRYAIINDSYAMTHDNYAMTQDSYAMTHDSYAMTHDSYNTRQLCYDTRQLCYDTRQLCYDTRQLCNDTRQLCYDTRQLCSDARELCNDIRQLCGSRTISAQDNFDGDNSAQNIL